MSIIRVQKTENFVIIDKRALQDTRLSWKAKGILAYLLSMPNDWMFYMEELVTHATDGESSFRSGMQELKKLGYVTRRPIRDKDTQKIIQWETIVQEVPETLDTTVLDDFPQVEKPQVENLHVEKPQVENQGLLSINNTKNNGTKNDLTNIDDDDKASQPNFHPIEYYQQHIGFGLSGLQINSIISWTDILPNELIKEAMDRTVRNAPNKPYNFLKFLVEDWSQKGFKTLQDVLEADEQYEQSKKRPQYQNKKQRGVDKDATIKRELETKGHYQGIPNMDF